MQRELSLKTAFYQKRHKRQKNWKKVFMILASVVVFCTTYALILPAITMEPDYICGYDTHIHNEDCYRIPEATPVTSLVCKSSSLGIHEHTTECFDENGEPKCGIADFVLHTHNSDCFNADGELLCTLPEIKAHVHDESCWQQAHVHEEACYTQVQGELLCTIEEGSIHTHVETCYTSRQVLLCELTEEQPHTHGDGCYTQVSEQICQLDETEDHIHTDECYQVTDTLTCELEETEGHLHSESCFDTVQDLTCTLETDIAHIHSDACFSWTPQLTCAQLTAEDGAEPYMICEEQELYPHTHTSDCFTSDNTLICNLLEVSEHIHNDTCFVITLAETDEPVLMCGMEVHEHTEDCIAQKEPIKDAIFGDALLAEGYYCGVAEHSHQADTCYDEENNLMCTMAEHEHTWICELAPADLTDMETEDDWEATLPELTGDMAHDLVAVAESQLGYEESAANYLLTDEEELLYYSRYGAWWDEENPYGDWNAKFISFCLNYAGITDVPFACDTANWPDSLIDYDQWFVNDGTFIPSAADLVFFDTDGDNDADRAGIITYVDIENNHMTVIHERNGKVRERDYTLDDSDILGYARNPGNELTLDLMDYSDVQNVIDLIDALPSADEIDEQMMAYEDAEDYEGLEAWYTAVVEQVHETYRAYYVLSEDEKALVTNADKLLELDYIWSQAILIEEIQSKTPTTVGKTGNNPAVSTSEFVKLNIYDYYGTASASAAGKTNINAPWNSNNKYPGFQWNGGAYMTDSAFSRSRIDNIDFGNSMITDFTYGGTSSGISNGVSINYQKVGRKGGAINEIIEAPTGWWANKPTGISVGNSVMLPKLKNGYPALSDGTSLSYLFSENVYASKKNTANIDGLFRQNQTTGEYWFDSRDNHAQYANNRFTLYNQIITPNFILYPFGNFLPFNDITNRDKATQVSAIDYVVSAPGDGSGGYMQEIIDRLQIGTVDATEQQLIDMLARYRNSLGAYKVYTSERYHWTVEKALIDYFSNSSEFKNDYNYTTLFNSAEIQTLLNNLYNIDFDVKKNFLFGMDMEMNFMQPKDGITGPRNDQDMIFLFEGDDDVWVFIDGILFLDLTGIHRHVGGDIDFVKGEVNYYMMESYIDGTVSSTPYKTMTFAEILTDIGGIAQTDLDKYLKYENGKYTTFLDYSAHNFKFYYMERGTGSSVCRINFNFPLLRENSITVTKENVPDNTNVDILGSPDYYFNIVPSVANAAKPLIGPDSVTGITEYRILDESGNEIGTGTVDKYGIFTLKAGQTAVFEGIEENSGGYYVQELIPAEDHDQYKDKVTINGFESRYNNLITWSERAWIVSTGLDTGSDGQMGPYGSKWYGYSSQNADASASRTFSFNAQNGVLTDNLGSLRIEKELIEVDDFVQLFAAEDPTFNMTVTLDGLKLPVGTAYTVHYSDDTTLNKMVTTAGIVTVPAGGYVVIDNILAGTEYTVTEQDAEEYNVEYKFPGEDGQTTTSSVKAQGIVDVNTEVVVRVINSDISVKGELTINKTVVNPDTVARDYKFRIVQVDANGAIISGGIDEIVTMDDVLTTGTAKFSLGYAEADIEKFPAVYYYRITEVNDKAEVQENNQIFLAEVTVTQADDTLNAQLTNLWACTVGENDTLVKGDTAPTILFQNTLLGSLTLSKTVVGTTPEAGFSFKIKLTEGTSDVPIPAECIHDVTIRNQDQDPVLSTWKFVNGETTINGFMDGEYIIIHDIPFGTAWTIEEINADGYMVTYTVNNGEAQTGAQSTGSIIVGNTEVSYTNSAMYELPETGGSGVARILTCGGLLTIMPCLWLLRRQRYRGRRVTGG